MRTTQLKIGIEKKEAILVAGGSNFKIYTVSGMDAWVISSRRQIIVVEESSSDFKTVGRYVNLRYQPIAEQESVKNHFESFLRAKTQTQPEAPTAPTLQP